MLNVQEYLRKYGLDKLQEEFAIKVVEHEADPLLIMNYNMIDSPKFHPIADECRGLVLEKDTWRIVARGFKRFYNYGEGEDLQAPFNWDTPITTTEKLDGSLILIYNYNDTWRSNTRGSFGGGILPHGEATFGELVVEAMGMPIDEFMEGNSTDFTFTCELTSPWNKVVRRYTETKLRLLSVSLGTHEFTDIEGSHKFEIVESYDLNSYKEISNFIDEQALKDPTFEGFVVRDMDGNRKKIKSATYVTLHHLMGGEVMTPKRAINLIDSGEVEEVSTYYPEFDEFVENIQNKLKDALNYLRTQWSSINHEKDRKEFAKLVMQREPWSKKVMFQAYDQMNKNGLSDVLAIETVIKSIDPKGTSINKYLLKHLF